MKTLKCISITLLITLILSISGYAQVWSPVGKGISAKSGKLISATDGVNMYVADKKFVHKWNGLAWSVLPQLPLTSNYEFYDIKILDTTLYAIVYQSWGSMNIQLFTFKGQQWTAQVIPGYAPWSMHLVNNEIYFAHALQGSGGIYSFDGNSFTARGYAGFPYLHRPRGFVQYNGDIYMGGEGLSTTSPSAIRKYNSVTDRWEEAVHYISGASGLIDDFTLFTHQNKLWAVSGDSSLFIVDRDTLFFQSKLNHTVDNVVMHNGDIYLQGYQSTLTRFDGTTLSTVMGPNDISDIDTLKGTLYAFSYSEDSLNGIEYNYAFRTSGTMSMLTGNTYLDNNSDCFRNTTEPNVGNAIVSLGNFNTSSGKNGQYAISSPAGTYSIDTAFYPGAMAKNLVMSCPLPTVINLGAGQSLTQDIAFENTVAVDMQTFLSSNTGWRARYGFTESYQVDVNNAGNSTSASTTVNVEIPGTVTIISTQPAPSQINGNVYSFDFLNVQPLESRKVKITAKVDTANNAIGGTLVWRASLNVQIGDSDLTDNSDTLIQTIVGAVDPNDKQANASQIAPTTKRVDYHIRFQNTGSDTAYKVTVVDTLDMTLPITHVLINSASHSYSLSLKNNILIWEFDNIMLPDSSVSFLGSQGFVRFSAGIDPSASVGDTIKNNAQIYFDYQPPVHTNHAKTAIVKNVSLPEYADPLQIDIYPNPAQNELYILNRENKTIAFQLIDVTGKTVVKFTVLPDQREEISVQTLSPGLYFLKCKAGTYKVLITSD